MKGYLLIVGFILLISNVMSLFSNTTNAKFNITGINYAKKVVIDPTGTKIFTWNNVSDFQIYTTYGSKKCTGNALAYPIVKVIWPANYNPILHLFPFILVRVSQITCNIESLYPILYIFNQISVTWRDSQPVAALSLKSSVLQMNLNSVSVIKSYNVTAYHVHTTIYTKDGAYLYVSQIINDGTRRIDIFDTKSATLSASVKNINGTITGMTLMKDGTSIMFLSTDSTGNSITVYKLDTSGTLITIIQRQKIVKTLGISDGNVITLFKQNQTPFEVVRLGDKKTLQTVNYFDTTSTLVYDCAYSNNTIVLLDNTGIVITAQYDIDAEPSGQSDGGFPIWVIIVVALVVVIGVVIGLLYCFQEKIPQKYRKKLPKIFNKEPKQPLIPNPDDRIQSQVQKPNDKPIVPQPPVYQPPVNRSVHNIDPPRVDGLVDGSDAQIIRRNEQIQKRQYEQRLRRQYQQRQQRQYQQRQKKQYLERQRRQYQQRQKRQYQQRQRRQYQERMRRDYEQRVRREQYEKQRRQYQQKQRMDIQRRRMQQQKRIEQQRRRYYIKQQQRRRQQYNKNNYNTYNPPSYQPPSYSKPPYTQPQSQSSSNPPYRNEPYNQKPIVSNAYRAWQQDQRQFIDERSKLIRGPPPPVVVAEDKPAVLDEQKPKDQVNDAVSKSFFVVKRGVEKDDDKE